MIFCSARLTEWGDGVWLNVVGCMDAGVRIDALVKTLCEGHLVRNCCLYGFNCFRDFH